MDTLQSFLYRLQFRRNTIWQIPLLLIITYPFWSVPVGNFLAPRVEKTEKRQPSKKKNFRLSGVKITLNRNGRQTAFIVASNAQTNPDETILMKDVIADIYDKNNDITKIKAKQGEYNPQNEQLFLKTDVVVHKTVDQQVLYTQRLYFNNNKQTIQCPGTTRIVTQNAVLDGGSFAYDITQAKYSLGKPVQCNITGFSAKH